MESHLARLIKDRLEHLNLSRTDFVMRMGYQNVSKGHQRLATWLRGHKAPIGDQPERIAHGAEVDLRVVEKAILADAKGHEARRVAIRSLDPRYYVIVRMMACVYPRYALPLGICEKEALRLASERARTLNRRCCLNTPKGTNYWIDAHGEVSGPLSGQEPTMRIGKRAFKLTLT